jgi:hypothetical protein
MILETANALREMADRLEAMHGSLVFPVEGYTLRQAAEHLRTLLGPEEFFSIRFGVSFSPDEKPTAEWVIYDGKKLHTDKSLSAVLNRVLLGQQTPAFDQVAEVEEAIGMAN